MPRGKATRKSRPKRAKPTRRATPAIRVPAGWSLDRSEKSISVALRTKDFVDAVDLIGAIAEVAEEQGHHPDVHLTRWNRLRITTYSHDVGGLTERDVRLAKRITSLLKRRSMHEHATS